MWTPLGPSRSSLSLDRTTSTSDALAVACRHARVGLLAARCADVTLMTPLRKLIATRLTYRPRNQPRHAREGLSHLIPRAPRLVSKSLRAETRQAEATLFLNWRTCLRAPFRRHLGPCPASGGAFVPLCRLAPSYSTTRPCDLPAAKTRDASDRCVPPERLLVYPYLACSQLAPAAFASGGLRRGWPLRSVTGGAGASRRPNRFGGSTFERDPLRPGSPGSRRAWALSSHGARRDRASGTPVASPSSAPVGSPSRVGWSVREPPRPRSARLREEARFAMTEDAFRQ
jgi:hypothetical protein